MGWHSVRTHFGVTMTGSTSVRYRSISKLADPDPITAAARSSTHSTGPAASTRPDLVPTPEVRAELGAVVAQAAEVDDAADAGVFRRGAEVLRERPLALDPVGALADAVHQEHGDVDVGHRLGQIAADVGADDLHVVPPLARRACERRRAAQRTR